MGWNNPAVPWKELERRLSGKGSKDDAPVSRKRRLKPIEVALPERPGTPYAELHCHSSFSFLDGASGPAELVVEAIRLGLHGLAITDHDGFYGAPLFAEAARVATSSAGGSAASSAGGPAGGPAVIRTVYGAELSLGLTAPQLGVPDPGTGPGASHLLVLARGVAGYHRLAAAITEAQLRGDEKGRPVYDLDELAERASGDWLVLTGCRKGAVRQALADGPRAAAAALAGLVDRFGRDNVAVELTDHGLPLDSTHNDLLAAIAAEAGLPVVATNNVHYATPERHRLADADGSGPRAPVAAGDGRLAARRRRPPVYR